MRKGQYDYVRRESCPVEPQQCIFDGKDGNVILLEVGTRLLVEETQNAGSGCESYSYAPCTLFSPTGKVLVRWNAKCNPFSPNFLYYGFGDVFWEYCSNKHYSRNADGEIIDPFGFREAPSGYYAYLGGAKWNRRRATDKDPLELPLQQRPDVRALYERREADEILARISAGEVRLSGKEVFNAPGIVNREGRSLAGIGNLFGHKGPQWKRILDALGVRK